MNATKLAVPVQLIEDVGTGEDTIGIIGKRVRCINTFEKGDFLRTLLGSGVYNGAEGTVIHVAGEGSIFADFGNDPAIPLVGRDKTIAVRVAPVGNVNQDPSNEGEGPLEYEIINDHVAGVPERDFSA